MIQPPSPHPKPRVAPASAGIERRAERLLRRPGSGLESFNSGGFDRGAVSQRDARDDGGFAILMRDPSHCTGRQDGDARFGLGHSPQCEFEAGASSPQTGIGVIAVRPELGRREQLEQVDFVDAVLTHAVDGLGDLTEKKVP